MCPLDHLLTRCKAMAVFLLIIQLPMSNGQYNLANALNVMQGEKPLVSNNSIHTESADFHNEKTLNIDWFKYQRDIQYFHSDRRCIDDILSSNYREKVSVGTKYGRVTGRIAYLCDMPGLSMNERPIIHGVNGQPRSNGRSRVAGNVTLFLGIPYAKAPTKENNLRFKSPIQPDFWASIDCPQYKPACPQPVQLPTGPNRIVSNSHEDCLYMNIFTPYVGPSSNLFPVMVYIHDGDFEFGSGSAFPGHMLSASQQVVVVTFNYRLGLLGYFSTGDNSSAGNFGLLDQMQALRFIDENIDKFNGDPSQITVFGSGSGAVSAGLLALSPLSSRFVKRVIASSGSPLAHWALLKDLNFIRNNSLHSALAYGCAITCDSIKLVDCLSTRSHNDICLTKVKRKANSLSWSPVIDSDTRPPSHQTLPESPESLIRLNSMSTWRRNNFAYMTGVTRDDGFHQLLLDPQFGQKEKVIDSQLLERVTRSLVHIYHANPTPSQSEAFENAVKFLYFPQTSGFNLHGNTSNASSSSTSSSSSSSTSSTSSLLSSVVHLLTDSWYTWPLHSTVNTLMNYNVPTYVYLLNYSISSLALADWQAAAHDLEYLLVSGAPFLQASFYPSHLNLDHLTWSQSDRNMSQFIMQTWGNFAKFGNPTPLPAFGSIVWTAATKSRPFKYLSINDASSHATATRMHSHYRPHYAQFWSHYLKSIMKDQARTLPLQSSDLTSQIELRFYRLMFWTLAILSSLVCLLILFCSFLHCHYARSHRRQMQYAGRCFNEIEKLCQSFTTAKTNDACFDHAKQITTQQQQHQQQQEQQQQQQQQQQVQVNQMEEKSVFNSISSRKQLEQGDLKHFPHYLLTFTRSPRALPRRTQIQSSFGSKDSVNIGNMNSPSPTNGNISFRDFDQLTKNQAATNKCTASGASNASNSSVLANVDDLCSKSNSHSKVTAFHEYEEGKTFAPLNASYKGMKERSKSGNFNQSSKSPVTYESKSSEVKKILSTTDGASISRVAKYPENLPRKNSLPAQNTSRASASTARQKSHLNKNIKSTSKVPVKKSTSYIPGDGKNMRNNKSRT